MSDSYAFLTRKCSIMQHGNSSFFPQNSFPPRCQMTFLLRARATVTYMHMLSSCGSNGKCNLNYNSPESYTVDRGASEQSHKTLHRVYGIDSVELGKLFFSDKQEYKPFRCAA